MKHMNLVIAIGVLSIPLVSLSAEGPNLSGTWVKPPARLNFAGTKIAIQHKGNDFALKSWSNVPDGVMLKADIQCTVGGGPCQVNYENLQRNSLVSKFEWRAYMDGEKLVAELSSDWKANTPHSQKYIYSLSPDGKTLKVEYLYVDKLPSGPRIVSDTRGTGETYARE